MWAILFAPPRRDKRRWAAEPLRRADPGDGGDDAPAPSTTSAWSPPARWNGGGRWCGRGGVRLPTRLRASW